MGDDAEWDQARPALDEWAARAGFLNVGQDAGLMRWWADVELEYRLARRPIGYEVSLRSRGAPWRWARFETLPPATLFLLGCFVSNCIPYPRNADVFARQPGDNSVLRPDADGFQVTVEDGSTSRFSDEYFASDFARYLFLGWNSLNEIVP